ncbi:hypothetical protein QYE76_053216 [Lolium multiflorum]|uniref:Transposase (putative) gypsy type domain-containing protein n=1 Tax=Lolium multiflorum TaxID=4521 RepID=A0AAD8SWG5_LOLMU|nr:hypothetical protein QYE76_053216 [Lolium multiflorum]
MAKRKENKMHRLGLISNNKKDTKLFPGAESCPKPPIGFVVMFVAFLYRGLSLPTHEFLHGLISSYGIKLWQRTPNSNPHLAIFITICESFLGIKPHWGLWKKIFFVKRHCGNNGPYVMGGVGFVVRRIHLVMSRGHPMWMYTGPKDSTRINTAYLLDKELLDEITRLTLFSQEDTVPLESLVDLYDAHHLPAEGLTVERCYPPSPESGVEPEYDGSKENVEEVADTPEASAPPAPKRTAYIFADVDEMMFESDEGEIAPPAPKKPRPILSTVNMVMDFTTQFVKMEAENAQLRVELATAKSSTEQIETSNKLAAEAWQRAQDLEKELSYVKVKLEEEQKLKEELSQEKSLGELAKASFIDNDGPIEVLKHTSRLYGALLAFQLMMWYGAEAEFEELSKTLPIEEDDTDVDLSPFTKSACTCGHQLIELVEVNKKGATKTAPSGFRTHSNAMNLSTRVVAPVSSHVVGSSNHPIGNESELRSRTSRIVKDLVAIHASVAIVKKKGELATKVE